MIVIDHHLRAPLNDDADIFLIDVYDTALTQLMQR